MPQLLGSRFACFAVFAAVSITACGGSDAPMTAPLVTLTVATGRGIVAQPAVGRSSFQKDAVVAYSFVLAPGYKNLRVVLDGTTTNPSGTITMTGDRSLAADADTNIVLKPEEVAAIDAARSILTSADPARSFASMLQAAAAAENALGSTEAARRRRLISAYGMSPVTDAAAIQRVLAALAGEDFDLDISSPSPAATSSAVATSGPLPITIIFVNGIWTDTDEAIDDIMAIRNLTASAGLPAYGTPTYKVSLHPNVTALDRPHDNAVCNLGLSKEGLLRNLSNFSDFDRIESVCGKVIDFYRATLDLANLLGYSPSSSGEFQALANRIRRERQAGRGVIVIGHSQGTLIAQQALGLFFGSQAGVGSDLQKCTGFISLAGPAPNVLLVHHLKNFYAQGDVTKDIILELPSTSGSFGIVTDTTVVTDADFIAGKTWGKGYSSWIGIRTGIRLHDLVGSYLSAPQMRSSIQQTLRDHIAAIRTECVPFPATLSLVTQPGGGVSGELLEPQPLVEVRDANGFRVGSSSLSVTASLSGSVGVLSGKTTVDAENGIASFTDLRVTGPGSYRIVLTASGLPSVTSSSFQMSPALCVATPMALPFTVSGDLQQSTCVVNDLPALSYGFGVPSQRAILFTGQASGFTPFIRVGGGPGNASATITGVSGNSSLPSRWLLLPGQYSVSLGTSTGTRGAFELAGAQTNESASGCENLVVLRLSVLSTNQSLAPTDCNRGGTYADLFSMVSAGSCTITMRSTTFDTYLEVYSGEGSLIARDDDGAGGTDSKVTVTPCYSGSDSKFIHGLFVYATSFNSGITGAYSLTFEFPTGSAAMDANSDGRAGSMAGLLPGSALPSFSTPNPRGAKPLKK